MNARLAAWMPASVVLVLLIAQLAVSGAQSVPGDPGCAARGAKADAAAAPLDFLFASESEWKQYASSAELEASR